jgi:NAD(P)H dehydrogenase (quinone)
MPNIAIAYASGRGHTRKLAEEIATTLGAEGCAARLIDVEVMFKKDWDALMEADAILFGAPTYMGSAAAAFKHFMDETGDIWVRQAWVDKLAGGFTVATFPGGDKLSTLMQLTVFAAQHGMVWVGQDQIGAPANKVNEGINQSGAWLGLAATSVRDKIQLVSEGDLETARRFAARMARAAKRWA